jgi:hypothetical protein
MQTGSGTVYGGMHVTGGLSDADARDQTLEALSELRSQLDGMNTNAADVEQARTAADIVEREITAREPNHATLRAALTKLQNLVLAVGTIAGTVNKIAAALGGFGVR